MKLPRLFFAALMLALSVAALPALGKKDQDASHNAPAEQGVPMYRDRNGVIPAPPEKTQEEIAALPLVRVSGIVRLTGSAFRPELVLSGQDGEWYLEPEDRERFMNLQQQTVTAEGRLDSETLFITGGKTQIRRLILRNAKIAED